MRLEWRRFVNSLQVLRLKNLARKESASDHRLTRCRYRIRYGANYPEVARRMWPHIQDSIQLSGETCELPELFGKNKKLFRFSKFKKTKDLLSPS
jgi:hypothetical protein